MNEHDVIITVDTLSRALKYEGSLILGVRGDNCAQKVYFDCPKAVSDFITDVSDGSVSAWVDLKNAFGEIFKMELAKLEKDTTSVYLAWTITNDVTYKSGEVSFNLCIQKVDADGNLHNEWHTTNNLIGKVLPSVDASKKTPIVITHDSATLQRYAIEYANLSGEVTELKQKVLDYTAVVEEVVDPMIDDKLVEALKPTYVSGNAIFSTNLYGCNEFLMTFRIDIANVIEDGMCGLYNGNYNTPIGLIMYEFTAPGDTGQLTYTIRGTKVHSVADELAIFVIECNVGDSSDSGKVKVPSAMSGYQLTVGKDTGFKLIVSHQAQYITDAYLITK